MELSQRRVNSVQEYLLDKVGSNAIYRLKATGYGESQLLNECGNGVICEESQHQENRRTTFKIEREIKKAPMLTLEERMQLRQQKGISD